MDPLKRYARQIAFAPLGKEGQKRLLKSSAVIIGCGALGTVVANNLARAGVGRLRLVDRDVVEIENLGRQILYTEDDVTNKSPKAIVAVDRLKQVNSSIDIEGIVEDVGPNTIEKLIDGFNIVIDATDNMETRFIINDACIKHGIPWIYGGVLGSRGMVMTIIPEETACLRCLIEEPPSPGALKTCYQAGVLNTTSSIIASIQSTEAIKILTGIATGGKLIQFDVWNYKLDVIDIDRRLNCPTCSKNSFEYLREETLPWCRVFCGRNSVQINPTGHTELDLEALAERLKPLGQVAASDLLIHFSTSEFNITIYKSGRTMIEGTLDESVARGIYSRYIGA